MVGTSHLGYAAVFLASFAIRQQPAHTPDTPSVLYEVVMSKDDKDSNKDSDQSQKDWRLVISL